jgi:hypothetical protein
MRLWPAPVLLFACGTPCERYVDAVFDCYEAAGISAPAGADVGVQCPDNTTRPSNEHYACLHDAWAKGDCGSEAGLRQLHDQAAQCTPD